MFAVSVHRCSASFRTPKDLIGAADKVKQMVGDRDAASGFDSLIKVVRIKNMFGNIANWNFDCNLDSTDAVNDHFLL